ncbi:hypothetical protein [Streptomyces sp. NBC_00459]|uniref:hypothetical protein n=1 Tax=Streptomyces sp. NBC_00459 TaxID=2975749 RepID=UPI002E173B66
MDQAQIPDDDPVDNRPYALLCLSVNPQVTKLAGPWSGGRGGAAVLRRRQCGGAGGGEVRAGAVSAGRVASQAGGVVGDIDAAVPAQRVHVTAEDVGNSAGSRTGGLIADLF